MNARRAPGSVTALALAVGLAALALGAAEAAGRYTPSTWIQRDGRFYTNVNVTLAESGSLDQDEFAASWYDGALGWNRNLDIAWSNLALGRDGRRLPKHPIVLPLLSTPLYWAFGLFGTLVFNLLLFGVAGGAAFAFARRGSSVAAGIFAALALVGATSIREYAYDYHVDVLILGLFTTGAALAAAKRGLLAGLAIGVAVSARPTVLLFVPCLALLLAERRAFRQLGWAVLGGAIPVALYALSNHHLYGAPWYSGYNRVLVVVDGVPQLGDSAGAFDVPFDEGIRALWEGPWGVRTRLPMMFAAAPGLALMVRRRPLYVLGAVATVVGSVLLFARYRWYGDRFLWPSAVLLLPALAVGFDAGARAVARLVDPVARRLRGANRSVGAALDPERRALALAALAAATLLGVFSVVGPPLEERFGSLGAFALALAAAGALGLAVTRLAWRAMEGPIAILAGILVVLLPGVRERLIDPGADVAVAIALPLALAARRWPVALTFAGIAGLAVAMSAPSGDTALLAALARPAGRPLVVLLTLAAFGALALGSRAGLLAPLALLAIDRVAALGDGHWPLFAMALTGVAAVALLARVATVTEVWLRDAGGLRRALAAAGLLLALGVTGLVARASPPPFRIASWQGVRTADVSLGEVPCDFLAWEHLNWECATFDRGTHGQTGLATSAPLHVGGAEASMFLVSTQRGRPRTVRWEDVEAAPQLALRFAVPDELSGGGSLVVRVDGEVLDTIALPPRPDGTIHQRAWDTSRFDGRAVTLELELRGPDVGVVVDGGFRE